MEDIKGALEKLQLETKAVKSPSETSSFFRRLQLKNI